MLAVAWPRNGWLNSTLSAINASGYHIVVGRMTQAQAAGRPSVKRIFAVEVSVVVFLRIVFVNPVILVGSKPRLLRILHRRYPACVNIAMVMANLRRHRWRCG